MKIGIVTWYKNYNYGGTLQAFALKTILESIGVEVEFINYDGEDSNMKKKTIRIFRNMAFSILYPNRAATRRKMKKFIQMNIPETKHFNSFFDVDNYVDKEFDAVIAGSDQIWNSIKGYNKFYYLDFSSDVPKIAYAPSMEKIDESKKEFWEAVVFSLNKYSALSVRESVIKEFLESNLKKEVKVVVDPTLLLNCKEWFNALDVKDCNCSKSIFANEEYICVYMITYNEEYFNQINIFAKKNNLKVLYLASSKSIKKIQGWIYPRTGVGVEEFLDVIHNAKYFFTDSYHGTLFGLQLSKKMLILKRFKDSDPKNQNSRLLQILNLYNIKNIYVDEYNIKKVINNIPDVDYSQVHKEIDIQRKESILWLLNNIETLKKRI